MKHFSISDFKFEYFVVKSDNIKLHLVNCVSNVLEFVNCLTV